MKPYYERDGVTIYHGDCLEILPSIPTVDTVLVDPVWPNAHPDLVGSSDPSALWTAAVGLLPDRERLLVWLGCQSDPRFLAPVDDDFLCVRYLRRAVPYYSGRCLVSGDILYAFGKYPVSRPGRRVIPGEYSVTSKPGMRQDHPCARNEQHADWVVKWWCDGVVLDPFCGVGTILVSAKNQGLTAIGIEIEERYCEIAAKRLSQSVMELTP